MSYTLTVDGIDLHYHLAPGGGASVCVGGLRGARRVGDGRRGRGVG